MNIILFDGVCNLCNGIVIFIVKRDPNGVFKFASLQSEVGERLLQEYNIPKDVDSFFFLEDGKCYDKSTAALRVCRLLPGLWKLLYPFIFLPKQIRDSIYGFIAKNRYKWFGKKESCMIPTSDMKKRFLQ